jgi:hypothetical protein
MLSTSVSWYFGTICPEAPAFKEVLLWKKIRVM